MARAAPARAPRPPPRACHHRVRPVQGSPCRRGVGGRERAGARAVHGRRPALALRDGRRRGARRRRRAVAARARGAGRLRPGGAPPLVRPRPHADPRGRGDAVRAAHGPGDPLHPVGPRAPRGPRLPLPRRLSGARADGPAEPHLDAGRARARRRAAALPRAPADAPARGVPPGLPGVPGPHARGARRALPPSRRLGLPAGAERQGVGRRAAGRPHGLVARVGPVRGADAPRAGGQGAPDRQGAGGDRRGPHLPLARPERAPLPGRRQAGRARARAPGLGGQEPRVRGRRGAPRRRDVHARLLPARAHDPPHLGAADRALPGRARAPRHGRTARAPRRARRRAGRLRRAAPSGGAGRRSRRIPPGSCGSSGTPSSSAASSTSSSSGPWRRPRRRSPPRPGGRRPS